PTELAAAHRGIVSLLSWRKKLFCPPGPECACAEKRRVGWSLRFHISADAHESDDDPLLRGRLRRPWTWRRSDRLRQRGAVGFGSLPRFGGVVAFLERRGRPVPGKVERRAFPLGQPNFRHDHRRIRSGVPDEIRTLEFIIPESFRMRRSRRGNEAGRFAPRR